MAEQKVKQTPDSGSDKYEFVPGSYCEKGWQIRAKRSFGDVHAGDLGGYMDPASSISSEGDAWLYPGSQLVHSKLSGNAVVKNSRLSLTTAADNTVIDNCSVVRMCRFKGNSVLTDSHLVDVRTEEHAVLKNTAAVSSRLSGNVSVLNSSIKRLKASDQVKIEDSRIFDLNIKGEVNILDGTYLIGKGLPQFLGEHYEQFELHPAGKLTLSSCSYAYDNRKQNLSGLKAAAAGLNGKDELVLIDDQAENTLCVPKLYAFSHNNMPVRSGFYFKEHVGIDFNLEQHNDFSMQDLQRLKAAHADDPEFFKDYAFKIFKYDQVQHRSVIDQDLTDVCRRFLTQAETSEQDLKKLETLDQQVKSIKQSARAQQQTAVPELDLDQVELCVTGAEAPELQEFLGKVPTKDDPALMQGKEQITDFFGTAYTAGLETVKRQEQEKQERIAALPADVSVEKAQELAAAAVQKDQRMEFEIRPKAEIRQAQERAGRRVPIISVQVNLGEAVRRGRDLGGFVKQVFNKAAVKVKNEAHWTAEKTKLNGKTLINACHLAVTESLLGAVRFLNRGLRLDHAVESLAFKTEDLQVKRDDYRMQRESRKAGFIDLYTDAKARSLRSGAWKERYLQNLMESVKTESPALSQENLAVIEARQRAFLDPAKAFASDQQAYLDKTRSHLYTFEDVQNNKNTAAAQRISALTSAQQTAAQVQTQTAAAQTAAQSTTAGFMTEMQRLQAENKRLRGLLQEQDGRLRDSVLVMPSDAAQRELLRSLPNVFENTKTAIFDVEKKTLQSIGSQAASMKMFKNLTAAVSDQELSSEEKAQLLNLQSEQKAQERRAAQAGGRGR